VSRFVVHVVPRSSRPGPDGTHDGLPRLRVKAAPTDGKANAEAERALSAIFGTRVTLVGGASSRRNTFEVQLDDAELTLRLREAFG